MTPSIAPESPPLFSLLSRLQRAKRRSKGDGIEVEERAAAAAARDDDLPGGRYKLALAGAVLIAARPSEEGWDLVDEESSLIVLLYSVVVAFNLALNEEGGMMILFCGPLCVCVHRFYCVQTDSGRFVVRKSFLMKQSIVPTVSLTSIIGDPQNLEA